MLHKLLNQSVANQAWKTIKPNFFISVRVTCCPPCPPPEVSIKSTKYQKISEADRVYDFKNMKIGRPMSPHLTIYRHELHSNMSILQRLTGATLGAYALSLGLQALLLPCQIEYYLCSLEDLQLPWPIISVAKFWLAFPFVYHYINGIRYLIWESTACGINIKANQFTGLVVLATVFSLTALFTIT